MHQQQPQQQQRSNGDGTLSPTSNQLARWFSPELLAQGTNIQRLFYCFYFHNLGTQFKLNSIWIIM